MKILLLISFLWIGRTLVGAEIHDAVNDSDLTKVTALLKANPKAADAKDANGLSPLATIAMRSPLSVGHDSKASRDAELQIAEILISNGARIDGEGNQTGPLLGACINERWKLAKLLIEKGAKVNVSVLNGSDKGATPLHYAAFARPGLGYDVVQLLVEHKAAVNAKDAKGFTPLHLVGNGTNTANLLIASGANINAKTNDGRTPLSIATENRSLAMIELLQKRNAE